MIDKTFPNRLQTDTDQKYVRPEVGEMVDAQNVTISEGGTNSGGVIKNVRGTTAATATAENRIVDGDAFTVIGSVSDPQRGYIYWFVSDDSGNTEDAIYRQDVSDNTYEIVIKSTALNFRSTDFVKADVVNAAFQQDDVVQTALFFTDNYNPPRKINVDRAINGDYDGITLNSQVHNLGDAISTVKAAETRNPTFYFSTDEDIQGNKFVNAAYQFATQYVYRDGEVSAISPYSPLAVSAAAALRNQEGDDSASLAPYTQNVCEVTLNVNPVLPDMAEVRLLAREGNNGAFFIVDQFDPSQDISRNVYGTNKDVFNAATQIYRFYNDRNGALISQVEVNKLYDNVPFLAAGQTVASSRLMYSNYTEGRANIDISNPATFTVNYSEASVAGREVMNTADHSADTLTQQALTDIDVLIDLLAASGPMDGLLTSGTAVSTTPVPIGTLLNIGFDFAPTLTLSRSTATDLCSVDVTQIDDSTGVQTNGTLNFDELVLDTIAAESTSHSVLINITTGTATTVSGLASLIIDELEEIQDVPVVYDLSSTQASSVVGGVSSLSTISGNVTVYYNFEEFDQTEGNSTVSIKPVVSRIDFSECFYDTGGDSTMFGSTEDEVNVLIGTPTQAQFSFTSVGATYLTEKRTEMSIVNVNGSFKAGCSHSFGIVFYDRFNRSGNVQELGSVYVDALPERSSGYGPASITIDFANAFASAVPDWAVRYQIVYPGRSSIGDFTQYTVGGGYRALKKDTDGDYTGTAADSNSKRIYVSLKNLDLYQEEKGATREYSFTEGDKLRVIKGRDATDSADEYYTASDSTIIEFDVVGVEILSGTIGDNPIEATAIGSEHKGTFIVLECPAINSGANGTDGNPLTYTGFDWDDMATNNYWDRNIVVEIYSPKSEQENKVYYEIGHGGRVGARKDPLVNELGDEITVTNGDIFVRPISCKSVHYSAGWKSDVPEDWPYETLPLESSSWTDAKSVTDWHRGRAHVIFEEAAEVRRRNGITYSDAYAEDVEVFSLSSFNASLGNFFSLDAANGACNYIGGMRDGYLAALQENSVARVPLGKDIITSPNQSGIVSLSTRVLGEPFYYIGDFGCGDNPESVLIRDGGLFFVDTSRKKVVRLTGEGLSPISENGIDSLFKDQYDLFNAQGGTRIVSGYDPEDNQYYVTLRAVGTYGGITLGYSVGNNTWQSRYTFYPDMYADQNSTMYSAFYVDPVGDDNAIIFHSHDNETDYNTFYGTAATSIVKVVSNYNPSMVKVFNAVSLETDSDTWGVTRIESSEGAYSASTNLTEIEGSLYGNIAMDESGDSTRHIIPIGAVATGYTPNIATVPFDNRVNVLSLPVGATVMEVELDGTLVNIGTPIGGNPTVRTLGSVSGIREITLNAATSVDLDGKNLVLVTDQSQNGDPIRGHWAEITLTNAQTTQFELFCVNTHFVDSKQNHALGQQ
jgi:hypothetical protein